MIDLTVRCGLCNRMREIASGIALSRATDRPLRVYWLRNKFLNCSFSRLFEPIEGVRIMSAETGRLRALLSPASILYRVLRRWRMSRMDLFVGLDLMHEYRDKGIDLATVVAGSQRCGIEMYSRFYGSAPFFEDFQPKADIVAEVDKTLASFGADDLVGVHIRRGDNDASIEVSPLKLFIERMQAELERRPETSFFLATDDPSTEDEVRSRFPGKVFTRSKVLARDKAAGVRDALVDLLLLSRCRLVLGSYWSSFSQTAAEIGETELEIVRIPSGKGRE